jgi:DNA-binding protein Fis
MLTGRSFSGKSFDALGRLDAHAATAVIAAASDIALMLDRGGVIRDMTFGSDESSTLFLVRLAPPAQAPGPAALHGSAEVMLASIAAAPDAFVVTDTAGRILAANPAFIDLAQLATEEQARAETRAVGELSRSVDKAAERVGRVPLKELVQEATDLIERLCIESALELTHGNRASAAQMLGLSRQSLYVKVRKYGIGDLAEGTD